MSAERGRPWATAALVVVGLVVALALSELVLRAAGLPRADGLHKVGGQFERLDPGRHPDVGYVNRRSSAIRFEYPDDPRGYFGPGHAVLHRTNALGFRGPDFPEQRAPDVLRVAFLGDSFTFGEGAHAGQCFFRSSSDSTATPSSPSTRASSGRSPTRACA